VSGVKAAKIDFVRSAEGASPPFRKAGSLGGVVIQARCGDDSGTFMDVRAKSTKNNAEIQIASIGLNQGTPDEEYALDRDFDKGETLEVPNTIQASANEITLTYSTRKGSHTSAVFQVDHGSVLGGGNKVCLVGGTATQATP
jgi:hypothetical protein